MLTKTATKILKNSQRIICQTAEDGYIYIGTGYFVFRVTPYEYTEFVQPATMREAGDYDMTAATCKPRELDLVRIVSDSAATAEKGGVMRPAHISFNVGKTVLLPTACKEQGFISFVNRDFVSALAGDPMFRSASALSAVVAYEDDKPVAVFMPVKPKDSFLAAARGYFGLDNGRAADSQPDAKTVAELRGRLAEKEATITQMGQQNALLRARVESLKSSPAPSDDAAKTISGLRAQLSAANQELEELKAQAAKAAAAQEAPTAPEPVASEEAPRHEPGARHRSGHRRPVL